MAAALLVMLLPAAGARGDAAAGRAKAQTCFACHGPEGNSATGEVPSLAGQQAPFIATQLHLFHDGGRKDAQMAPMTVNLTDRDIDDLAAYFAQVAPAPPQLSGDATLAASAQPLLERGQCIACHGAALAGQEQVPRIAGQQRAYLAWQLRSFRDGKRPGIDASMREATKPLSNKDINLIADYVSQFAP